MPSTPASRARAAALTARIATIRTAHGQASAVAQLEHRPAPPYSHLSVCGLADHFPALLAAGDLAAHVAHSLDGLLAAVERELERHAAGGPE